MSSIRTPLTVSPHEYFGDITGRPLDYGTIYFGEPDKDPEFYPIDVYSDEALTQPIPQPIRTKGGFINVNGDIIEIYGRPAIYSVKVLDQYGRKIFYKGKAMRNNVNDDIIAEIDAAIQQSKDDGVEYAKKVVKSAIDETVIENGVVTDRLVAVTNTTDDPGPKTQHDINNITYSLISNTAKNFITLSEAAAYEKAKLGSVVFVANREYINDGGGGLWQYVDANTVTADGYTKVSCTANTDLALVVSDIFNTKVNIKTAGAKDDVDFDSSPAIKSVFDNYKNILVPEGVFALSTGILVRENTTVNFEGWLKIKSGDDEPAGYVLGVGGANVTLNNPQLDGNRESYEFIEARGRYAVLTNYGNGRNLKVNGGILKNGINNIFQGGRNGLYIKNTIMDNAGEHCVYMNARNGNDPVKGKFDGYMSLDGVLIKNPAQDGRKGGTTEAHFIQIRNSGVVTLNNVKTEGFGTDLTMATMGVLATYVDNLRIKGCEFNIYNSNAIWFGPDASLGSSGDLSVEDTIIKNTSSSGSSVRIVKSDSSESKIAFARCRFKGCFHDDTQGQLVASVDFISCNFDEVPSKMTVVNKTKFEDCFLDFSKVSNAMLQVDYSETTLYKCVIQGNSTSGVVINNDASLNINDVTMTTKTGGNAVLFNSSGLLRMDALNLPVNTNAGAVKLTSLNTKKAFIGRCYMPSSGVLAQGEVPEYYANNIAYKA